VIKLPNSAKAWGQENFSLTLKSEIENLGRGSLPLEKATNQGGIVEDQAITAIILRSQEHRGQIKAKISVFFGEKIAGCNCDDDPIVENTYCELEIQIDKQTTKASFKLLQH